jgi:hypothetical protein
MVNQIKTKLVPIPVEQQVSFSNRPDRFICYHSDEFVVQCFKVPGDIIRIAVHRKERINSPRLFKDGISWDELQEIKRQCGYADRMAVEIYPPDRDVLNIMNVRHLWLLPEPLDFAWRIDSSTGRVSNFREDRHAE